MKRKKRLYVFAGQVETSKGTRGEKFYDVTDIPNDGEPLPSDTPARVYKFGRRPVSKFLSVGSIGSIDVEDTKVYGVCDPTGDRWACRADVIGWRLDDEQAKSLFALRAAEKRVGNEVDELIDELVKYMPASGFNRMKAFVDLVVAKLWHKSRKERE